MRTRTWLPLLAISAIPSSLACKNDEWPGPKPPVLVTSGPLPPMPGPPSDRSEDAGPGLASTRVARIILTPERVGRAKRAASRKTKAWQNLYASCENAAGPDRWMAGYEGWDWANGGLNLALCFHVTGEDKFGRIAALHLKALVSDLERIGDGKVDLKTIQGDNGYSIRTRGALAALIYDWLHTTKFVDQALKKRVADQISDWLAWYGGTTEPHGYMTDKALYNYYAGYFGAIAFFGIAFQGDDPRAAAMLAKARADFRGKITPEFSRIRGGEWPEGWQYGPFVAMIHSAYVDAESRLSQEKIELPWLHDTIPYFTHARWPDGVHLFDSGDWLVKPPTIGGRSTFSPSFVFDDKEIAQAVFLARTEPGQEGEWQWLRVVTEDPSGSSLSPQGDTSYLAKGTGTVFARTSWRKDAVWFASSNGPHHNVDHQRLDAGHFELVRSGDDMYVASSAYGSLSTKGTNALLVDDSMDRDRAGHLDFPPSQGIAGTDMKVDRFEDATDYVYARADLTDAYRPFDFAKSKRRSVERMVRHYLFSRRAITSDSSARLVVFDTVRVAKATYGVTFSVHPTQNPEIVGSSFTHKQKGSSARFTMLVPSGVQLNVVKEPTSDNDKAYLADRPYEGFLGRRVEAKSATGKTERTFLSVMTVGAADAKHPTATHIGAPDLEGAELSDEAYVFAKGKGDLSYTVSGTVAYHVIADLLPKEKYSISVTNSGDRCAVKISPGGSRTTSEGGTLAFGASGCALK